MRQTTYQVTMSSDGRHTVTVTIEDPAGTDAALAWAQATYAKLVRDDAPAGELVQDALQDETPPICGIHDLPMVRVNGRKGPFWSCHEKNPNGNWCSYKPLVR